MKFIDFAKQLKEGVAPIYLAEGNEAYFRERVVEGIREKCITQPSLNDVRLEGDDLKGDKLVAFRDSLSVTPFLSEYRMVRVYEFYPSEKDYENVLKRYFENPCPSTVLVIVNSGKKSGGADLKKKKAVTFVDCAKENEEVVAKWLYGTMKRSGLLADADSVTRMVRYCANDCARLKKEVEKLRLLLGEGGRVTGELVEEQIVKDIEYKTYELSQAAARRSFATFTEIMLDLKQKGYDEHAILATLTAYYRGLYEAASMKGSDGELSAALGKKPYAISKDREQAMRIGKERVKEYFLALYTLSSGAKSGDYTKEGALYTAICKIFFD